MIGDFCGRKILMEISIFCITINRDVLILPGYRSAGANFDLINVSSTNISILRIEFREVCGIIQLLDNETLSPSPSGEGAACLPVGRGVEVP